MIDPDVFEWQLADVLTNEQALFILWTVKSLFCTRREDFLREYEFTERELDDLLHRLKVMGFLQEDSGELILTEAGEIAVSRLGIGSEPPVEENLVRASEDIQARFNLPKERIYVENRLIEQLRQAGWLYPHERDPDTPYLAAEGRETYRDVLLKKRLKESIRSINREAGKPELTEQQINEAIHALERLQSPGSGLLEANKEGMRLLCEGTYVSGTPDYQNGANRHVRFIEFEHPGYNDFLALNQFRIEVPGRNSFIIPDVVLFVNGIPLVVIECKSPALTDPIEAGVAQLQRYASQEEGVPALFHFNLFLVATCFYLAKLGTLGTDATEYQQWKDPYPRKLEELAQDLSVGNPEHLSSQQLLVAGALRKENLLDLLQNFILFRTDAGRTVKLIARYQQYRAVQKSIYRLQHGSLKTPDQDDQRGGIIWHTQGSGKSLTMVFLIRKMRRLSGLSTFKIVIITDRQDLQDQLRQTMQLTGEGIKVARDIPQARALLARPGDDIIFIMIQKARADEPGEQEEDVPTLPDLDRSPHILLIVDEAHRSHTSKLHSNIMNALPNCAKIGFTGTPIMIGTRRLTQHIFGDFIDRYTILEAEQDGATVPILYEGYQAYGIVVKEEQLDQAYLYLTQAMPHEVRLRIENLYASERQVLEAQELIDAKARHILLHYAANILPNGFKALVVANSRKATVRYQAALVEARRQLVDTLAQLSPQLLALSSEQREELPQGTQLLLQAYPQLDFLRTLECAAIISSEEDDELEWRQWSEERSRKNYIERFKLPLSASNGHRHDSLALLCVQQMLLTGFDAPVVQGLYLDRRLIGHNLLQAVARVNRTYTDKTHGLVVDYLGVARQLKEALLVYSAEDVQGALISIKDELLKLEARHLRLKAMFSDRGIDISKINLKHDRETIDASLNLFKDARFRADFEEKLKKFLESMDAVLPRPEALRYVHDMEVFGYINKSAANFLPEEQINIKGTGKKVRKLIDEHIAVLGIEQTVAPISITDADFERRIDQHVSDETKASQMEHLARYYIKEHYEEDPEHYERLSRRLQSILDEFKGQWTELVKALYPYIWELRRGRPADPTGLDPRTQLPFLDILAIEASRGSERYGILPNENITRESLLTPEQRQDLAKFTIELVNMLRTYIRRIDFWRGYEGVRELKAEIIDFLDERNIISPFQRQNEVADRLIALAKRLHRWLIA
jgi:type I restriction enzyme R subunit